MEVCPLPWLDIPRMFEPESAGAEPVEAGKGCGVILGMTNGLYCTHQKSIARVRIGRYECDNVVSVARNREKISSV